ncbi:uncharacterized protein LOC122501546 [Leptopilina heterotoma]|uniref:uncharacterized protein LOC122501546 n=1 Tax=Leptopilina heterotoma TaxID=63436 RepID=UPI001CA8B01B|nr:uncharacterized protein LOC122501546 [Leptopilina heterotoma]
MPYMPQGSRRSRERGGRKLEELGKESARMERRGRPQSRHRPFPEFAIEGHQLERPSYLSFPITEEVNQEPLRAQQIVEEGEPREEIRPRRAEAESEEGAVGGLLEPITMSSDWADLSALEKATEKPIKGCRPDGAEIVVPYRWPADRRPGESNEEYESRLAEFELDRFLRL